MWCRGKALRAVPVARQFQKLNCEELNPPDKILSFSPRVHALPSCKGWFIPWSSLWYGLSQIWTPFTLRSKTGISSPIMLCQLTSGIRLSYLQVDLRKVGFSNTLFPACTLNQNLILAKPFCLKKAPKTTSKKSLSTFGSSGEEMAKWMLRQLKILALLRARCS